MPSYFFANSYHVRASIGRGHGDMATATPGQVGTDITPPLRSAHVLLISLVYKLLCVSVHYYVLIGLLYLYISSHPLIALLILISS